MDPSECKITVKHLSELPKIMELLHALNDPMAGGKNVGKLVTQIPVFAEDVGLKLATVGAPAARAVGTSTVAIKGTPRPLTGNVPASARARAVRPDRVGADRFMRTSEEKFDISVCHRIVTRSAARFNGNFSYRVKLIQMLPMHSLEFLSWI